MQTTANNNLVTSTQIQAFKELGAIHIEAVVTTIEMAVYRPMLNNAVQQFNTETRKIEERDTYGKAFLQVMNLWEQDEAVRQFTLHERFGQIAAALLGVERVRLYHDQALYKEPGGGATPWHQDQYYWPLSTTNTITLWMPLVDLEPSMGILTFAGGSHKDGLVKNIPISDESEALLDKHVADKGYRLFVPASMKAGDATFHYGNTLHKAPGNYSGTMREVMTIIYFADGATVTKPVNNEQEADRQRWLGGIAPGELAASALNPVIG